MQTKDIVRRYGIGFRTPVSNADEALERRFQTCWGAAECGPGVWRILKDAYREPHRCFHKLGHIAECLQLASQYAAIVGWPQVPQELELALWFHDLVYEPGAKDNERRSAESFRRLATEAGLRGEIIDGATSLILETKSHEAKGEPLSSIMCDSDLWILGSEPERYQEYARQVRQEHTRFADWEYRYGRRQFLRKMLRKKSIYSNPLFEEAFGAQARANLRGELFSLKTEGLRALDVTQKDLPGLSDYFVVSRPNLTTQWEDEEEFLVAAHREARRLAQSRYGDPDCYALVYNGASLRRRSWPHFHVVLAKTRTQKRWRMLLLWFKGPLRLVFQHQA